MRFILMLLPLILSSLQPVPPASPAPVSPPRATMPTTRPLLIAHRGASGYRPEHTLAAYRLAIEQGADFIEPDLVLTKDGHLIARHEPMLAVFDPKTREFTEATTNITSLPHFASRLTTRSLDGEDITAFWAEDFTLAEIKTLRARERIPHLRPNNTPYNDQFEIPTLEEIIALAKSESARLNRPIGIYPETKHPTYHAALARRLNIPPMETTLLKILHREYGNTPNAPVFIQSFEVANLRALRTQTQLPLVQLLSDKGQPYDFELTSTSDFHTYADLATPAGLAFIATYADGIGPHKSLILPRTKDGTLAPPTDLVKNAHAAGLKVHPWTFRAENTFLPPALRSGPNPASTGDLASELRAILATGIDGLFTDHPDLAKPLLP